MGNFRDLRVWRRAQDLALEVYRSTSLFPEDERYGLTAQMRRAAISVSSNIAEGCGKGSVRELECQLLLSYELGYIRRDVHAKLDAHSQEISRMLNQLIRSFRT